MTDPNQLTYYAPQRRLLFRKRQSACPSSASIWLPFVVLNARDRTNLRRHVARGTNLPFGKPSRDIGCCRSLIVGNARLTQNSATPRMKLVDRVAFDEEGHTLADPA